MNYSIVRSSIDPVSSFRTSKAFSASFLVNGLMPVSFILRYTLALLFLGHIFSAMYFWSIGPVLRYSSTVMKQKYKKELHNKNYTK